jgi:hypothetical protein
MQRFWLPAGTAVEFSIPRHLALTRLALYWGIDDGLIVLFPRLGEEDAFRAAAVALPRSLERRPLFMGIADLTTRDRIDWRSYHYDFVTPLDVQAKMHQALFGI